ncbi:response regulator [Tundrisphaera lichenicola]|uniref:response regulator n=1 Tax=Tundrisphaera lichenicola TaxID=2029860 RepID=UPI003EBF9024
MSPDFQILLIDDSVPDAKIIGRALIEAGVPHRLTVIHDGRQALDHLRNLRDPALSTDREPDLILLDLNLPGIDGIQILTEIKNDFHLKLIPVVVLSTSRRDEDVLSTYRAGANTFIQKPAEFPRYIDLVLTLRGYWHQTALRLPRDRSGSGEGV